MFINKHMDPLYIFEYMNYNWTTIYNSNAKKKF